MSEAALMLEAEMAIPCPVCKTPQVFIEGEIDITKQLSFFCHSKKCQGRRRYVKKEDLKIIIDNFNKSTI